MTDTLMLIISWALSMLAFSSLFNKLNSKYNLFKEMQDKTNKLDEKRKGNLRVISFLLILPIYAAMGRMEVNIIIQGLVMGFLFSLRDVFLKRDFTTQI